VKILVTKIHQLVSGDVDHPGSILIGDGRIAAIGRARDDDAYAAEAVTRRGRG
jgi:imidazolonepropionase-like amidohydrolase